MARASRLPHARACLLERAAAACRVDARRVALGEGALGRGLFAAAALRRGDVVLRVPHAATLRASAVPPDETPARGLARALHEALASPGHAFHGYGAALGGLPAAQDLAVGLLLGADEAALLQDAALEAAVAAERADALAWASAADPGGGATVEELLRCLALVRSRSFGATAAADADVLLAPVADLLNHAGERANCVTRPNLREKAPGVAVDYGYSFEIVTVADVEAGEELVLSYGDDKAPAEMMLSYGFAPVAERPSEEEGGAVEACRRAAVAVGGAAGLRGAELPADDAALVGALEAGRAEAVEAACESWLSTRDTTIEEDRAELERRVSPREAAAVAYRLERKRAVAIAAEAVRS